MFGKTALYLKDFDWFIVILALAIALIGVVEIHSATQYDRAENFYVKQIYLPHSHWLVPDGCGDEY
jgi:hypothetical protein